MGGGYSSRSGDLASLFIIPVGVGRNCLLWFECFVQCCVCPTWRYCIGDMSTGKDARQIRIHVLLREDFCYREHLLKRTIFHAPNAIKPPPPVHRGAHCPPIFSYVFIKLPMNVVIKRLCTATISSGTSQMVAPIFLAMLMASFAFW